MPSPRCLRLVRSTDSDPPGGLRVAFASTDRTRVNQHFGTAESLVVHDIQPGRTVLSGIGLFPAAAMDGREDKLEARIAFLQGCAAVYAVAIGGSAIRRLLASGIQPIRVDEENEIEELLAGIARAMTAGGVHWIERALRSRDRPAERFDRMAAEGWTG